MATCSVEGCGEKHYARTYCKSHYDRVRRTGSVDPRPVTGPYVAIAVKDDSTSEYHSEWEHRIIAARVLGKPLPEKAQIHHWDGNGRNNANSNIVICEDLAYHKLLHRRQRIKSLGGNPNTDSWCSFCKAIRPLEQFWFRKSGPSKGRATTYCKLCELERKAQRGNNATAS